jgi:threonine dehydrogenase-like Zn-dependent dehydrogenase
MAEAATEKMSQITIGPAKKHETLKMKAAEWMGKKSIEVNIRPRPVVTDPHDVILRVTATCICGSDLHLYLNNMPGMQKHDVMGHEFMGIIEDVGTGVKNFQKGDRVVSCFDLACGQCFYCKKQLFSCCDTTNNDALQEKLYGHHTAGIPGYSHTTGGYEGGQAEFARVPFADVNLLKVPSHLKDEQVVFLSDILPTAWHANELAQVHEGDTVGIWGSGPVGILAAHCAFYRGAKQVILVDSVEYRLEHARKVLKGNLSTINFKQQNVLQTMREMLGSHGLDVGIDAVGMHYTKSIVHTVQKAVMAEVDQPETINEMIQCVRKGGRLGVVGVYGGFCNGFLLGAFMEKGMSMAAGQTPVQKYWHHLLKLIEEGKLDATIVITHERPLDQAPILYKLFDEKLDNCIKVVMKPRAEE